MSQRNESIADFAIFTAASRYVKSQPRYKMLQIDWRTAQDAAIFRIKLFS
jgi:hypothetical protein